jgi:hypothetical protein
MRRTPKCFRIYMMSRYIKELEFTIDPAPYIKLWSELPEMTQHNLKYRECDELLSFQEKLQLGSGTLRNQNTIKRQDYTQHIFPEIKKLENQIYNYSNGDLTIDRIRFMNMTPITCLSYHIDPDSIRYHIPLITDTNAFFVVDDKVERMPDIGRLYSLQTNVKHTAINASTSANRLHIVFSTHFNK